jgi:hypothetical protein
MTVDLFLKELEIANRSARRVLGAVWCVAFFFELG